MGKSKYTIETVNNIFESHGCQLLSNIYINNRQKLDFICKCGNKSQIVLSQFLKVPQCNQCGFKQMAKSRTNSQEKIESFARLHNCTILSKYSWSHGKIEFKCVCGNITNKYYSDFYKRPFCQKCGHKKCIVAMTKKTKRTDIEDYKKELRFKKNLLSQLRAMKNTKKSFKTTINKLGYDSIAFNQHLEKFKNESNKNEKMVIDHIFPVIAFLRKGIYDLKIINHLSNIQLITDIENRKKGQKYDHDKFEEWLKQFDEQRKETHA